MTFHYKTNTQDWYLKLPSEINEPLTEFLSYILVKRSESGLFLKTFEEVDSKAQPYYRRWRELMDIVKKELKDDYLTLALYPFMIAFVRSKTWKTFEEFRQN